MRADPRPPVDAGSQTSPLTLDPLRVERRALVDIGQQTACNFEIIDKVAFRASQRVVLLVEPERPVNIAHDLFQYIVGLCLGIAGVVDGDGVAAMQLHPAGIGERAQLL